MKHELEVGHQHLLLTIPQTARELGLSRAKVYSLLMKGEGPPTIRFGRSIRVRAASLQEWVEQREKEQLGGQEKA